MCLSERNSGYEIPLYMVLSYIAIWKECFSHIILNPRKQTVKLASQLAIIRQNIVAKSYTEVSYYQS